MRIAIANDHAGVELKNTVVQHLLAQGHEVINLGTDTISSYDYPLAGAKLGLTVRQGKADLGIGICGTGVGISLACNKVKGIRAVVCSEPYSAIMSRKHNNTNILCFGARVIGEEMAILIVDEWLKAEFEGGRHEKRVNMIMDIESRE